MRLLLVSILLSISTIISAQLEITYNNPNAPQWAKEMYSPNPDPEKVITQYEAYYKSRPFIKNEHTQYYKRWLRKLTRTVEHSVKNNRKNTGSTRMPDWSCIGPYDWDHDAAGRSYAPGSAHVYTVEQSISDPDVLYAGTATAGIWKTVDRGLNWIPLSYDLDVNTVYAIEIDHSNPLIAYASMLSSIYKTIDGGVTWNPTGNSAFQNTSLNVKDIVSDPEDELTIIVACQQGLYRTTNGGTDWTLISGDNFLEVEFHPTDSDIVYVVRADLDSDNSDDHTFFHRSINNGVSFSQIGAGWPSGGDHQRRTEISVSLDKPDYVFAHATGQGNGGSGLFGIYKSTDQGDNWTFECCGPQPAGPPDLSTGNINIMAWAKDGSDNGGQYYYDVAFGVSPFNADSIWAAGVNLWVSGDQGASFVCDAKWSEPGLPMYVHADNHDLHYYEHTGEIWIANDGGIFLSTDNGASFDRRNVGIEGTDFWGFDAGWWEGDIMLGGAYHNGTHLKENDVYINEWLCTDGGDGNYGRVHPARPKNVHSWFNIKDLNSDRTIAPTTRGSSYKPNASYITGEDSDLLYHPQYYDTYWVGSGNAIHKTEDNGFSFTQVHDFGVKVVAMALSPVNPDIMYASTWPSWWGTKQIFKTIDGGTSWTDITPPQALLVNQFWMPYDIVADTEDPNRVTVLRTSMYNESPQGAALLESINGGSTWNDISGNVISNVSGTTMESHQGTNGGLFIGSRKKVYYKDDTMADFEDISSDLPISIFTETVIPYYREQKVRISTNRSVWERDFTVNSSKVIARPALQKDTIQCTTDSVYFRDLSVISEQGDTYIWIFEGGTPATSTEKNPTVVFECPGIFDVTLQVSDDYGTETVTIPDMVTVLHDCDANVGPYKALSTETSGDYASIANVDWSGTSFTMSAWIKPSQIQADYAGIFMSDGSAAGLNFREGNNTLGYHWPGGSWSWDSNLEVPIEEWSYVALVVQPNLVTIYLNDKIAEHIVSLNPYTINSFKFGSYQGWGSRNFYGQIEEMCIWDKALTTNEIRQQRHIIKDPILDSDIIAYYNFNRDDNIVSDLANDNNGVLTGGAVHSESSAPVGIGSAELIEVFALGTYTFSDPGVELIFSDTEPEGDIVVSHLLNNPSIDPSSDPSIVKGYYITNVYTKQDGFPLPSAMHIIEAAHVSDYTASNSVLSFHNRNENEGENTWSNTPISSYNLTSGTSGEINIPDASPIPYGQLAITRQPYPSGRGNVSIKKDNTTSEYYNGGSSSELSLVSDNQGFTLPQKDQLTIESVGNPIAGSMAYDKDSQRLIYFDGISWNTLDGKLDYFSIPSSTSNATSGSSIQSDANTSSLLSLSDASGIIILPSYTNTELLSIATPVSRMIIYNSEENLIQAWYKNEWKSFQSKASSYTVGTSSNTPVEGIKIGSNTISDNASLEITGLNFKTLAIPSLDHEAIASPPSGTFVYSNSSDAYMLYNGSNWMVLDFK